MPLVDTATGEKVASLTPDAARLLTDQIKRAVSAAWELVTKAYSERAWAALGYSSWDDYCSQEFGASRLRLPREERQEVVASLREAGLSTRAIVAATGASKGTVSSDLAAAQNRAPAPNNVVGLDGKRYQPKSFKPEPQEETFVCLGCGDLFDLEVWECPGCEHHLSLDLAECKYCWEYERNPNGDLVYVGPGSARDAEEIREQQEQTERPAITKPDLGGGVSHPARYSDELFPHFAELLDGFKLVLDPFAGTGKIHVLQEHGHETVGIEIEPEWANLHEDTIVGDARSLEFADGSVDAICTSPTYGNRLADHHNASDPHLRRSYKHDLGRDLSEASSGAMHWGEEYRAFHAEAWREAVRVLRPGGRFILNIKDHVRSGVWQPVTGWHVATLNALGLVTVDIRPIATRALRQGTNADLRVDAEMVIALDKPHG